MGREGKAGGEEGRGMGGIGEGRGMVGLQAKAWPPVWGPRTIFLALAPQVFHKFVARFFENRAADGEWFMRL